jgi:hypothetical protein
MPDGDRRDFTVDVKDVAGWIVWRVTLSLVVETHPETQQQTPNREHELRVRPFVELSWFLA